jgi:hypothetical protein
MPGALATTNRRGVPFGIDGSSLTWNRTEKFPAPPLITPPVRRTGAATPVAPTRPVISQTSGVFVVSR